MAVNQSPLSRTMLLPDSKVTTGQGFSQLATSASAVGQLLTERINEVAIGQAALQGQADVQNEAQPDTLALPFTKATKAYNDAVSDTESRRMLTSAQLLIEESLANGTNPATFNRGTPAKFHSELEGIKSGILQHARDENREHIREQLDKMNAQASIAMLKHSISFDNQQTKSDFKNDITGLLEARRNAAVAGDAEKLAGIDEALNKSLNDYSTMNAEIARASPYYREEIEKNKAVDTVLSDYSQALHEKRTPNFLSDLAENKQKLPFNVWQESVKAVVALDQTEKRLKNDINAEQVAQVNLGITNGNIQNAGDIVNFQELTVPQKLTAMNTLETKQTKQFKDNAVLITAQQNILSGRPAWNTPDTRNKMFQTQIQNMEQQTGQVATLVDMEQSILGLNNYPASGLAQTAIGTNVPAFDATISQKLTGGDVASTAQAAMIFNDMTTIKGMPGSININGDALAVATLFNELNNGGTTPEQAAEQAINTVIHASEPQVAGRIDTFHKTLEKVNPQTGKNPLQSKFKETFGADPQGFGSQEAFKVFSDTYRANYISSNSEEAAFKATKYAMDAWGTSKYFDKGFVGQPTPEKDVPIAKVGNAFGNQLVSNVQGFINRTNAARAAHPDLNIPVVEWVRPAQTITGDESQQDKVFKKMTIGDKPRIKINGHETDVVLIPSATSSLDNRVNYLLGVYDQFNNLNPLKDITNGVDQVARFSPKELSLWSPSVAQSQDNKALQKEARAKAAAQLKGEVMSLAAQSPTEIAERFNQILGSIGAERGASATRSEITDADNVGIAPDTGQVISGNIDLNTRPRVKNPDGKISTVRTIGIQADGLEFVIPTVSDEGALLSNKEAVALFKKNKKHLGAFKTKEQATAFAEQLHESEAAKLLQESAE